MGAGTQGPARTHHLALAVGSAEEVAAWREYLRSRDVPTTEVFERGGLTSIYLRDPDGHIIEICAAALRRAGTSLRPIRAPARSRRAPGSAQAAAQASASAALRAWRRGARDLRLEQLGDGAALTVGQRADRLALRHRDRLQEPPAARADPSGAGCSAGRRRVIDSASHGQSRMTSAALISPAATLRLSSARASRTAFARSSACRCCGAGEILAACVMFVPPCHPRACAGGPLLVLLDASGGGRTTVGSIRGRLRSIPVAFPRRRLPAR